jgi:O-antigen ligase
MTGARPWLQWSSVVVLAATIVLFAFGSSSVPGLLSFGLGARWVGLFLLCGISFVLAGVGRPTRPSPLFLRLTAITALLVTVALLSASWSIAPRLTVGRSITLLVLFAAGASLAYAVSADSSIWPWILRAILAGAVAVCFIGLLVLAFARNDAMQWASPGNPGRYKGLGQNPNTVAMLAAIAMPIAFWLALEARSKTARVCGWLALGLLFGTIAAANSRGALAAGLAAMIVYAIAAFRSKKAVAASVALVVCLGAASIVVYKALPTESTAQLEVALVRQAHLQAKEFADAVRTARRLGKPVPRLNPSAPAGGSKPGLYPPPGGYNPGALINEVGRPLYNVSGIVVRHEIGTSGRLQAWEGALHQGDQRPLLGFGFGTEERVFVDRYYTFEGSRPENSYLGLYLQLGAVGLLLLLAGWYILLSAYVAILRGAPAVDRSVASVCAGVVCAGLLLTIVQSYVYSVGNIASVSFWICAFLLTISATKGTRRAPAAA